MNRARRFARFLTVLRGRPSAYALLSGSDKYPAVCGVVRFYQTRIGVLAAAEISGLPDSPERCASEIFAFHIHSGRSCSGDRDDPFADAMAHYDPGGCPHPAHAGDMPPLFANRGYAFQVFYTERFHVREIIGRTVIIHSRPDDFTTQPSGSAGEKIACGAIKPL